MELYPFVQEIKRVLMVIALGVGVLHIQMTKIYIFRFNLGSVRFRINSILVPFDSHTYSNT